MERKYPKTIEEVEKIRAGIFEEKTVYIEIPLDIRRIKKDDPKLAYNWRMQTREQFNRAFSHGFSVNQIIFNPDKKRIFYKLTKTS